MKIAEWNQASDSIAEILPGYERIKRGFARTDDWVVRGFFADSSSHDPRALYMQAFVVPRFIPTDVVYFNYGFRVDGPWAGVSPELVAAVANAEPRLTSSAKFDGLIASTSGWEIDPRHAELRLALAVLLEDRSLFQRANEYLHGQRLGRDWELEIQRRALDFVDTVEAEGFETGLSILESRRSEVDRLFV